MVHSCICTPNRLFWIYRYLWHKYELIATDGRKERSSCLWRSLLHLWGITCRTGRIVKACFLILLECRFTVISACNTCNVYCSDAHVLWIYLVQKLLTLLIATVTLPIAWFSTCSMSELDMPTICAIFYDYHYSMYFPPFSFCLVMRHLLLGSRLPRRLQHLHLTHFIAIEHVTQ